ncbi:EH domain-containing protein 4-like [Octopus sinensis]|uniref:EH domain-containing protein 4-like n=1 Tax=Octopus sinensis TaxID=2607531 RepID=A0A6P7U7V6_9MOLL|nr:EH domain-containing protein 4-like [Octopus sinensis]
MVLNNPIFAEQVQIECGHPVKKDQMSTTADKISDILRSLSVPYNKSVRPIEASTGFNMHCMSPLSPTHMEQKPSVLFMGSYSAGKTTAIKYLLQLDIPVLRVGPEPTTDMFHVLTYGEKQVTVGGVILMNDPHLGFQNFFPSNKDIARHFQLTRVNNTCLRAMDIIDSPGFLSGENMGDQRGYDLPGVLCELGKRCTRMYMMMDVFKVDVSPECKECLRKMRSMMGKMRLIFNKADSSVI